MDTLNGIIEFVYRSFIEETGEVLECDNMKDLYYHTRRHLRTEVGPVNDPGISACIRAVMEFGCLVTYEIGNNQLVSQWHKLESCGMMYVSKLSEVLFNSDGKELYLDRKSVQSAMEV